jgi:hypothetical protein
MAASFASSLGKGAAVQDKDKKVHVGHGHGGRTDFIPGVTADSTLWTADTLCVTADGRIICIPASVAEAASALDAFDAVRIAGAIAADVAEAAAALDDLDATAIAGGAVIPADVAEAASASDLADAISDIAADAIEAATATDELDAAIGAQVLFGTVDEPAGALDQLDATVEAVEVPIDGGGAYYPPLQRPYPVVGRGYGVLPALWGEAHGVVGAVGKSAARLVVRAAATGACGQVGNAAVVLKGLTLASKGAVGARGTGSGTIVKFSGSACGHHDDDEAAVIAILLAA